MGTHKPDIETLSSHMYCIGDLESPVNLTCLFLDSGKKTECLEGTHTNFLSVNGKGTVFIV